eukprot:c7069_g1_i1.p1 GENE.c7069_g1_i1~~c7069_g1_i1.p1  ORF type:complete len:286 (-),score=39.31 c7069_g1_i1:35-892(-)
MAKAGKALVVPRDRCTSRSQFWEAIAEVPQAIENNPDLFHRLQHTDVGLIRSLICRELRLLYPVEQGFCLSDLSQVLIAYAAFDPEVGYSSGMAFLAAIPLTLLPPEQAFWIFVYLMRNQNLRMLCFTNQLIGHIFMFAKIFETKFPKYYKQLNCIGFETVYLSAYFKAIGAHVLSTRMMVEVVELVLQYGMNVFYAITLTMFEYHRHFLKTLNFERLLDIESILACRYIPTKYLVKRSLQHLPHVIAITNRFHVVNGTLVLREGHQDIPSRKSRVLRRFRKLFC